MCIRDSNNRGTRNFWCRVEGKGYWSAFGVSAEQEFDKYTDRQDESTLEAGEKSPFDKPSEQIKLNI